MAAVGYPCVGRLMGSLRSTSTNTASASTTCVVNAPAGVAAGDLLIAAYAKNTSATPTHPSGWATITAAGATKNFSQTTAATNGTGFAWKYATGSEPANYTWTSSSSEWIITIFCFQGINFPILKSDGTPISQVVFDNMQVYARSGTTVLVDDNLSTSDITYDHYWNVVAPCMQEAGVTHTLSAPSAYLTTVTNNALVGISMYTGYAEFNFASLTDNPDVTEGQVTTSAATGNARGFSLWIADPIADIQNILDRPHHKRPTRDKVANQ